VEPIDLPQPGVLARARQNFSWRCLSASRPLRVLNSFFWFVVYAASADSRAVRTDLGYLSA
jgi:hypothetical protein